MKTTQVLIFLGWLLASGVVSTSEMMAADIPARMGSNGEYIWKFPELGAGEKRSVRVTYRVRSGIPVGTNIQIKNLVTYEDQMGNRY